MGDEVQIFTRLGDADTFCAKNQEDFIGRLSEHAMAHSSGLTRHLSG